MASALNVVLRSAFGPDLTRIVLLRRVGFKLRATAGLGTEPRLPNDDRRAPSLSLHADRCGSATRAFGSASIHRVCLGSDTREHPQIITTLTS